MTDSQVTCPCTSAGPVPPHTCCVNQGIGAGFGAPLGPKFLLSAGLEAAPGATPAALRPAAPCRPAAAAVAAAAGGPVGRLTLICVSVHGTPLPPERWPPTCRSCPMPLPVTAWECKGQAVTSQGGRGWTVTAWSGVRRCRRRTGGMSNCRAPCHRLSQHEDARQAVTAQGARGWTVTACCAVRRYRRWAEGHEGARQSLPKVQAVVTEGVRGQTVIACSAVRRWQQWAGA